MNNLVPDEAYKEIEGMIADTASVVGINAKDTHILIIYKLMELEKSSFRRKKINNGKFCGINKW